jgi:hypothetical protein
LVVCTVTAPTPTTEVLAIKAGRERKDPPPAMVFNTPAKKEATGSHTR